jgi:hypothetical protein
MPAYSDDFGLLMIDFQRDFCAADPEIRLACEKMVLQEGQIWGQLVTAAEMLELWRSL